MQGPAAVTNDSDLMSPIFHGCALGTLLPGSDAKAQVLSHPFAERLGALSSQLLRAWPSNLSPFHRRGNGGCDVGVGKGDLALSPVAQ